MKDDLNHGLIGEPYPEDFMCYMTRSSYSELGYCFVKPTLNCHDE
jgi:hypothetical protein